MSKLFCFFILNISVFFLSQSASKATKAKGGNVNKKIRFSLKGNGEGEEEDEAGEEESDPVLDMVSYQAFICCCVIVV